MATIKDNWLSRVFEAPGYRWLWLFSLCNTTAITVEFLSYGWVVLQLTNSALWVGVAAGVKGASLALLSVLGGPMVDRLDRRRLLLIAQLTAGIGALAVALLLFYHLARLWHVFCYLILVGVVTGISRSSAGGLLYDVVGPQRLLSANAFQSTAASLVRIAGAVAGGIIIDRFGVGKNWLLVSAAYCGGAAGLFMFMSPTGAVTPREAFMPAVRTGVGYARRIPQIRTLLMLSLMLETFGFGYQAMLPMMARDVLKVGGVGLGYLSATVGVGQLLATVCMTFFGNLANKGTVLVASAIGFGLFIAAFGLSPWFLVSLSIIMFVGALGSVYDTSMSTAMMTAAHDDVRGRVLSLYCSTMGIGALGWLVVGAVGTLLTVPIALLLSGSIVAFGASRLLPRLHILNALREADGVE